MIVGYIFKMPGCPSCENAANALSQIKTIPGISWQEIIITDKSNELAMKYAIENVPTVVIHKDNIIHQYKYSSIMNGQAYTSINGIPSSGSGSETFDPTDGQAPAAQASSNKIIPIVIGLALLYIFLKK